MPDPSHTTLHRLHLALDGVPAFQAPLVGRMLLGRGVACDICLPDPSLTLSRRHLELWVEARSAWARDLSRAGVRLGSEPLGPGPRRLRSGELLRLGPWSVTIASHPKDEESTVLPVLTEDPEEVPGFPDVLAHSPLMRRALAEARRLAAFPVPVLVLGETGAGKEGVARGLHLLSGRAGPWVTVNCGALHPETAMSTLFGHERGAFTGALDRRAGAIREADGGTLFLDEIGELSLDLQAALLRVLEARAVVPVGGTRPVPSDFRLVAATHRDLPTEVQRGRFREDLWYRLAVGVVHIPPLRDRPEDIPLLTRHFLQKHALDSPPTLSRRAVDLLQRWPWPGNVRELRNAVVRGLIHARSGVIDVEALGLQALGGGAPLAQEEGHRGEVHRLLQQCQGNRTAAARRLGVSRSTFYERLRRELG